MVETLRINPKSIYHHIEKSYEACIRFNETREKKLPGLLKERGTVLFSTDRQDILVNWDSRQKRNAIIIKAACSVDVETGFVFRYDVGIDERSEDKRIHKDSLTLGGIDKAHLYIKIPHLFLPSDMGVERRINGYIEQELKKDQHLDLDIHEVELNYLKSELRLDVELPSFHLTDGTGFVIPPFITAVKSRRLSDLH